MTKRKFYALIVLLILLGTVFSRGFDFALPETPADVTDATGLTVELLDEDGWYYGAHDVAMYLDTYGHLPGFIFGHIVPRKVAVRVKIHCHIVGTVIPTIFIQ